MVGELISQISRTELLLIAVAGVTIVLLLLLIRAALHLSLSVGGSSQVPVGDDRRPLWLNAELRYGPARLAVEAGLGTSLKLSLKLAGRRLPLPGRGERGARGRSSAREGSAKPRPSRVEVPWFEALERALRRRIVRVDRCEGWLRLGLGDPAATGAASGVFWSLRAFLPARAQLDLQPDYIDEIVEGEAVLAARAWPLVLVFEALWFALTRVRINLFQTA